MARFQLGGLRAELGGELEDATSLTPHVASQPL